MGDDTRARAQLHVQFVEQLVVGILQQIGKYNVCLTEVLLEEIAKFDGDAFTQPEDGDDDLHQDETQRSIQCPQRGPGSGGQP